jgi:hypothetical protein
MAVVAVPLALVALAWHVRQGARGGRMPSLRLLLLVQPVSFVAQEAMEHVLAGHGVESLVHSSAVQFGIVAQVFVAVLAMLLVRIARVTGQAVVAALQRRRPARRPEGPLPRPAMPVALCLSRMGMPTSERGPPDLLAPII